MTDASNRTIYLLSQYAEDLCTPAEADELFDLIKASREDETLYSFLQEQWNNLHPFVAKEPDWNELYQSVIGHKEMIMMPGVVSDRPQADDGQRGVSRSGPRVRQIYKWIAAASVIIVASLLVILSLSKNGNGGKPTVAQTHDVPAPSNTRAVITLADGSKVYLDSAGNGVLAKQSDVSVVRNNNGEIIYSPDHQITQSPDHQITYNTLYNPRGSKVISLTLSDGTKVWLNSESSLRYPASFAPSAVNREVEITGEAYFEVTHNSKQPFKVHLPNGSIVEDIGTSFNINSYPDEQNIKTTLIEGAVKISSRPGALAVNLKPGEQAEITRNSQLITHNSVDLESTVAWKNGQFSFNRTNIVSIMKQIERWYDVQVVFADDVKNNDFTGGIARTENVSELLKMLEKTGVMHFKIEGMKITVTK